MENNQISLNKPPVIFSPYIQPWQKKGTPVPPPHADRRITEAFEVRVTQNDIDIRIIEYTSFSPSILPGLVLWLDGNDPAGNGIQPTTGSKIATWVDKSTAVHNFTQGTVLPQPVFNSNVVGTLGSIFFNGSQHMECPYTPDFNTRDISIFIVGTLTTSLQNDFSAMMASRGFNGNTYGFTFYNLPSSSSPSNGWELQLGSNSGTWNMVDTISGVLNAPTLSDMQVTGANTANYSINSTLYGTAPYFSQIDGSQTNQTRIGAGANDGSANFFWLGNINEIIICTPGLSAGNIAATRTYLKTRWGIS